MTAESGIDYQGLVRDALLGVVRRVLAQVAREGLPGEHHLYVGFSTRHPGVELPASLARQFPDEMTIVLQNQFWNLTVDEERLAVTLRFSGVPSRISIPWEALRSVVDPSVPFGLRFGPEDGSVAGEVRQAPDALSDATEAQTAQPPADARRAGATVVDLQAFRKRE